MRALLFTVVVLAACATRAQGDVYVVMQTDAPAALPDVKIHDDIRAALAERSQNVKVAPSSQELRAGLQAAACNSSADVCAVAVGRALGGTHVIASRLENVDGSFTLELALHTLSAGTIVRHTQKSASVEDLRTWARIEALQFARLPLRGRLLVTDLPADAVVVVDGSDVLTVPMTAPAVLAVGAHQLEARINDGPVYQQQVTIDAEHTTTVRLCASGTSVSACTDTAPVVVDSGPTALLVTGIGGMVVGAAAIAFGGWAHVQALDRTVTATPRADHDTFKAMALAGYAVGGVVFAAGASAMVIAAVVE